VRHGDKNEIGEFYVGISVLKPDFHIPGVVLVGIQSDSGSDETVDFLLQGEVSSLDEKFIVIVALIRFLPCLIRKIIESVVFNSSQDFGELYYLFGV